MTEEKKHQWPQHQVLSLQNDQIIGDNAQFKEDLEVLCPHWKREAKLNSEQNITEVPTLARERNCDNVAYFETEHHKSLFLSLGATNGPTAKFEVFEITSKESARFPGDFFRNTRPLLVFDRHFDASVPMRVFKELLKRNFATPNLYFKSSPFIDHMIQFTCADREQCRLEMRVFSFADENEIKETGPFCTLLPTGIYSGALAGDIIWKNPNYATASMRKAAEKMEIVGRVHRRLKARERYANTDRDGVPDELDEFWTENGWKEAW